MEIHTSRGSTGRRIGLAAVSLALLAAVGCGFPSGRYGGDPMLGQFNRPIAPTPPIWTGGDPGVSPAWDAGARMGLPSPDVPASSNSLLEKSFIMPTFSGSLGIGGVLRPETTDRATGMPSANSPMRKPPASTGAILMPSSPIAAYAPAAAPLPMTVHSVQARPLDSHTLLTSGSSLEPISPEPRRLNPTVFVKDPRSVASVEEGQTILQTCGARTMAMEPQPTGEWRFVCTVGDGSDCKRYEAKCDEQIEAVRAVMWQIKNER